MGLIAAARGDVDPVGEDAAGGVELRPVQQPAAIDLLEPRRALIEHCGARLRRCVADDLALAEARQPDCARFRVGIAQPVLDDGDMAAEEMRDIGVGCGQLDQEAQESGMVEPVAAEFHRHPQRAEALLLEPADLLEGQAALMLARHRALGDPREDRPEQARHRLEIGSLARIAVRRRVGRAGARVFGRGCAGVGQDRSDHCLSLGFRA
jgi:hypothetical protein